MLYKYINNDALLLGVYETGIEFYSQYNIYSIWALRSWDKYAIYDFHGVQQKVSKVFVVVWNQQKI